MRKRIEVPWALTVQELRQREHEGTKFTRLGFCKQHVIVCRSIDVRERPCRSISDVRIRPDNLSGFDPHVCFCLLLSASFS